MSTLDAPVHPRGKVVVSRVLVLFAHPALERSRCNRRLVRGLDAIEGVTFVDLYEAYPQLDIDVEREKQVLEAHDVIVLQHPFYWYSTPAILKEYFDLVLEYGWAYGHGGTALHHKVLINVMTAGGGERHYCADGRNRFRVRELLRPIDQTAHLCGMVYLAPFVIHETHSLTLDQLEEHRLEYHRMLEALRDDRVDLEAAMEAERINADLDRYLITPAGRED